MKSRSVVAKAIGPYKDVLEMRKSHPLAEDFNDELEEKDVRVRVISAGLAFPDVLVVEGKHIQKKQAPFVPASEVCGTIVAMGVDGADAGFKVGDVIFGLAKTGAMSEYALMDVENAYHVPVGVSPHVAAGFEVNYGTTWHGLIDLASLKEGETLLVLGASGGVGMAAIDIGKAVGAKVVACASTQAKLDACAAAGADVLINYVTDGGGDFKAALKKHGVYGSVDVVYDPVGGRFSEPSIRALAFGGRFIVVGFASGGATPKDAIPKIPLNLALLNERVIRGVFWGAWKMMTGNEGNRENMGKMMDLVQRGKLKPVVSKVYAFEDYAAAFDDMMNRKVVGKVCIGISATGKARL